MRLLQQEREAKIKTWLNELFDITASDIYHWGIDKLLKHWQEVVTNEDEYIINWFINIFGGK